MDDEWDEFERRLRSRHGEGSIVRLRERVLRSVSAELARPPHSDLATSRFSNLYWMTAAAAVIVMGFSFVGTSQEGFSLTSEHRGGAITLEISAIRQIQNQTDGSLK